jgi:translation elongation factor P/translation initiation factor 5A
MTQRRYEEIKIEHEGKSITIRRILYSEKPKENGKYRCFCSQVISNLKTFENHLKTKSHVENVEKTKETPTLYYDLHKKLRFL